MKNQDKRISKFMSLVLRHQPEKLNITLDENGWTDVAILISRMQRQFPFFDIKRLEQVVAENDKKRFAFNDDKTKIRASQGHSVKIDLGYTQKEPPAYLYHGTVGKFMEAINEKGLIKMGRHHVHLSEDRATAANVGSRRGSPVLLTIRSGEMFQNGIVFYQSENGVWLTEHVAPEYIEG